MTLLIPQQEHRCQYPKDAGLKRMESSIFKDGWAMVPVPIKPDTLWFCDHCKTWWRAIRVVYRGFGHRPDGVDWIKIRWYHFTWRKMIALMEKRESGCDYGGEGS